MGKVDSFAINLEKRNVVYLAGETVRGTVYLKVRERLKINSVNMVVCGYSRVNWSESSGSDKSQRTRHYTNYEEHFNMKLMLVYPEGSHDLYLEPGDLSYPFQVNLPSNLPTSFEHDHAHVRYSFQGNIGTVKTLFLILTFLLINDKN